MIVILVILSIDYILFSHVLAFFLKLLPPYSLFWMHSSIFLQSVNNLPETLLRLEINDNAITSIDSRTFQPINGKLEVLNAQDNKLIGADLLKMFGTYNATMVFPNITRLDLSGNDFTTVPSTLVQGMPLLKTLYMHSNPKLKKRPDLNNLFKLENVLFDICPGTNVVGCSSVSLGCSSGNGWISCQNKDISGALHLNDDMSNVTHIYLHKNKSKRIFFFVFDGLLLF